jgi:hypothetical protein
MRFGAFLLAAQFPGHDHTTVLESTVAAAVAAEEAGFDDVWIAEHHFISYGICPSAITLAGYRRADGGPHHSRDPAEYTELLCRLHPVGTAEHCRDTLATTARCTGIGHVILLVEGAGDRTRTLENVRRLGAEILPHLRHRTQPALS